VAEIRDGRTYYDGAWTDGEYRHPVYPNPLSVRVGEGGVKVWMIIQQLRSHRGDASAVVQHYAPWLTEEDVRAAVRFYESNKRAIDEKLNEETAVA
jgi:uncharacterized protein (DUF433 family)